MQVALSDTAQSLRISLRYLSSLDILLHSSSDTYLVFAQDETTKHKKEKHNDLK